jgi:hypothetical protein
MSKVSIFFLIILSIVSKARTEDFAIADFAHKKYEKKVAVIGNVTEVKEEVYSPKFKQVKAITVVVDKYLGSFPKEENLKKITGNIIESSKMIAPFQTPWTDCFDCRIDIARGDRVLVYFGKADKKWDVVHISKIKNGFINFPAWNGNKEFTVSIPKAMQLFREEFKPLNKN